MRLIDADALRETMFHRAFEMDSDMQKWDGGCWIRYKLFENALENAPTIEAEPIRHGKWIKVECSHFGVSRYECSVCHYTDEHNESREVPYCWQCGARMENDDNM